MHFGWTCVSEKAEPIFHRNAFRTDPAVHLKWNLESTLLKEMKMMTWSAPVSFSPNPKETTSSLQNETTEAPNFSSSLKIGQQAKYKNTRNTQNIIEGRNNAVCTHIIRNFSKLPVLSAPCILQFIRKMRCLRPCLRQHQKGE